MGRINNGNWVSQHRKIQGKFQNKQDIEAYLFDKKLSNGNNIKANNRLNIDDLPNIPALLDYKPNLPKQNTVEPIDGGKAHTLTTQAFLTALTALSAIPPNITVPFKQAISADSQNGLSRMVKSFTETSKTPILFDATSATTNTSQNHDKSEESTKHNDNQSLIRVKRARVSEYNIHDNELHIRDVSLDTEMIKRKLKDNSNVNRLKLINVQGIDSQKAQEIERILKNSNINIMCLELIDITSAKELIAVFKDTNINVLQLSPRGSAGVISSELDYISSINYQYIQEIVKSLKDTNVEKLILSNNHMGDKNVINIIKLIKEDGYKIKILNLINNNISNKGAEDIASELIDTKITGVRLAQNQDIKSETLQKISMILKDNRQVNKESYTSKMESSTTQEEYSDDISGKQDKNEELTTPQKNLTERAESIAEDIVTDSSTPTPKESNPNNPDIISMLIGEQPLVLTALAVFIGATVSTVVYLTKKFCNKERYYTHDELALAEPLSVSHLDNNQDITLTGVLVNNDESI